MIPAQRISPKLPPPLTSCIFLPPCSHWVPGTVSYKLAFVRHLPGLPWWLSCKRIHLQSRRPGFNPWLRKIPRRRKWQPTPVLLPGKSHGQRSLVGYSLWGLKRVVHNLANKQPPPWHLQSNTRIKWCAAAGGFQHPWKEFRVENRNEALCTQGKFGRTGLHTVRNFQELILWA